MEASVTLDISVHTNFTICWVVLLGLLWQFIRDFVLVYYDIFSHFKFFDQRHQLAFLQFLSKQRIYRRFHPPFSDTFWVENERLN
jgi:hypothetical protein